MSRSVDAIVLEYHLGLLDGAFIAAEIKQVENCENGWDECDHSKLSPLEASQSPVAEHKRSISACRDGEETGDYSRLTPPEAETLADAEHKRNYNACITGHGYCDPSRLTPSKSTRFRKSTSHFLGRSSRFSKYPLSTGYE